MAIPKLLSLPDVADALHTSISTLYVLMGRGEFPVVKIGGRRYIRESDLIDYIDRATSTAA